MIALHDWVVPPDRREVVAAFGQGRLVQISRLRLEFQGGSRDDEIEARSWAALFMPEVVVTSGPSCLSGRPAANDRPRPRGSAR